MPLHGFSTRVLPVAFSFESVQTQGNDCPFAELPIEKR